MIWQKSRLMTDFKYEMLNEVQMPNAIFFNHLDFGIELTFGIGNLTLLTPYTAVYCGSL